MLIFLAFGFPVALLLGVVLMGRYERAMAVERPFEPLALRRTLALRWSRARRSFSTPIVVVAARRRDLRPASAYLSTRD